MKGYVTGNKLYIFDTAAEIPYVDAAVEIIYVQQEYLAAFKAANSDYAAMMQPYNFQMLTVKAKEWSGHTNDDIEVPEPEVQTYTLTLNDELSAVMQVWDNNASSDVDLSSVPAGHSIQINLNDGFTFGGEREGTLVNAILNGNNIGGSEHCVLFDMPEQNSTLLIQAQGGE